MDGVAMRHHLFFLSASPKCGPTPRTQPAQRVSATASAASPPLARFKRSAMALRGDVRCTAQAAPLPETTTHTPTVPPLFAGASHLSWQPPSWCYFLSPLHCGGILLRTIVAGSSPLRCWFASSRAIAVACRPHGIPLRHLWRRPGPLNGSPISGVLSIRVPGPFSVARGAVVGCADSSSSIGWLAPSASGRPPPTMPLPNRSSVPCRACCPLLDRRRPFVETPRATYDGLYRV